MSKQQTDHWSIRWARFEYLAKCFRSEKEKRDAQFMSKLESLKILESKINCIQYE